MKTRKLTLKDKFFLTGILAYILTFAFMLIYGFEARQHWALIVAVIMFIVVLPASFINGTNANDGHP